MEDQQIELIEYFNKIEDMIVNITTDIIEMKNTLNKVKLDEAVGTKIEAAKFIGYDEQTITSLLDEGRIISYGRGRIFIFHKSELLDIREVRNEEDRS